MMISVVLPTYNGSKYIKQSIESIINQTYKEWELIVIDDCSTDDTNKIVQEYTLKDNRIKLYKNETNKRLPASLNTGFAKTSGEYLTWTSDDNIYKENAFEKMIEYFQLNSDVGFVFSNMTIIDENGNIKQKNSYIPSSMEEIKYKNIVGASFMYKREVYKTIGDYDTSKFLIEDYDYWLRISRKFKIGFINDSLYFYRTHSGSLTESKNSQMLEAKIKLYEEELSNDKNLSKETTALIYNELAIASLGIGNYKQMKKYVKMFKSINISNVSLNKKVKISCLIGPTLTKLVKKLKK